MRYAARGARRANSCCLTPALATVANPKLAEGTEGGRLSPILHTPAPLHSSLKLLQSKKAIQIG